MGKEESERAREHLPLRNLQGKKADFGNPSRSLQQHFRIKRFVFLSSHPQLADWEKSQTYVVVLLKHLITQNLLRGV